MFISVWALVLPLAVCSLSSRPSGTPLTALTAFSSTLLLAWFWLALALNTLLLMTTSLPLARTVSVPAVVLPVMPRLTRVSALASPLLTVCWFCRMAIELSMLLPLICTWLLAWLTMASAAPWLPEMARLPPLALSACKPICIGNGAGAGLTGTMLATVADTLPASCVCTLATPAPTVFNWLP